MFHVNTQFQINVPRQYRSGCSGPKQYQYLFWYYHYHQYESAWAFNCSKIIDLGGQFLGVVQKVGRPILHDVCDVCTLKAF